MKEERDKTYIEGRGPTYAAGSLAQYISAFATRVLQSTYVCVKEERACARIFKLFRTPGINSTELLVSDLVFHVVTNAGGTNSLDIFSRT